MLMDPVGREGPSAAANVSPSQRLAKIRRRKKRIRDEMFSELLQTSQTDRAHQNAERQMMSECRKAQQECEESWWAKEVVLDRAKIQQPWSSEVLDGDELNLTCSHHATKASDSTIWYQQLPNPIPQFALTGYKETINSPEPKGALYMSADKVSGTLALHRVRLVYFCGVVWCISVIGAA
ncbi:uncharacterized protein LOC115642315 isoform X3 [Gopherus evgoodei]|uniref:uncharacterized protein LOC115642315 isoform X3 n=1 Tax=Gopherus evgoodei TaxID=1825980 RepID=UPI0011CFF29D|nr:uncharacterized protein LOC115642315 isoform X3 [Gopherus evgoodei]